MIFTIQRFRILEKSKIEMKGETIDSENLLIPKIVRELFNEKRRGLAGRIDKEPANLEVAQFKSRRSANSDWGLPKRALSAAAPNC